METVLVAPVAGRVRELLVTIGSQVETGAPLVRLEPTADAVEASPEAAPASVNLDLPDSGSEAQTVQERVARGVEGLSAGVLGFDLDPTSDRRRLTQYLQARDEAVSAGVAPLADELNILELLTDFAELSRNRPAAQERHTELLVHSPREHFHSFLQSLDIDRAGLSDDFRDKLARVLRHYGITDFDRTPDLEEAVFRIFLAQQRSAPEVALATSLLQRWLSEPAPEPPFDAAAREVLDRFVVAMQLRFPVIGDLARSVRFRWFDQPLVDQERESVLAGVHDRVDRLAASPDAPDHGARIDELAAIPERIVRFLAERLPESQDALPEHEPMLEVLIKRHYREHELHRLRTFTAGGRPFARRRLHARRPADAPDLDHRHRRRAGCG